MRDQDRLLNDVSRGILSRRQLLQALGAAAVGAPLAAALGQGRCVTSLGSPACDTTAIKPVFDPTGWKTVMAEITWSIADYQKEAAFYAALMGWKLRSDDGKQAVMDVDDSVSAIFKAAPPAPAPDPAAAARGGGRGGRGPARAVVESFGFGITPWDAKKVEAELRKRGLTPVADNDGKGFESFHIKDPDGWNVQVSNASPKTRRATPATAQLAAPAPFDSTGWKTVWLDHISFNVTNYKESVSFYTNLLGWGQTYDEGSQNEVMIGDVGDSIIRGGNPLAPAGSGRGISPWDTDGVRAELERRGLSVQVDTSSKHWDAGTNRYVNDEIHTAAFRSYHTTTPNGFNLQISWMDIDKRQNLANAVRPKPANPGGG
jgi:catechol 2,3-dioxygenase-like lactoylglutathione lyase family enzyme